MAGLEDFIKQIGTGDSVHDWQHAARIFTDGQQRLAPKYAFLFYVKFTINQHPSVKQFMQSKMSDVIDIGALAKSANLPKYTVETKTLNAYNRPSIVQNKLRYDPVTIKFHDDSASLVRKFWYDYMSFYYRDTDYAPMIYDAEHKYVPRQRDNWGYTLKPDANKTGGYEDPAISKTNFLQSISIYSMSHKRYHEYVLINPTITQFQHGEHNMAEGSGLLEHSMTVQFETVKYREGAVNDSNMSEMFVHYDRAPSPLTPAGGGTRSFFGQGGLFQSVDELGKDIASGNFLQAFLIASRVNQNFKGQNLGTIAKAEGVDALNTAIRTGQNPFSAISAPGSSSIATSIAAAAATGAIGSTSSSSTGGVQTAGTLLGSTPANGVTNNVGAAGVNIRDQATPSAAAAGQVTSNGSDIAKVLSSNGTYVAAFPQLATSTQITASQFVVPAPGDPAAAINNSKEAVSGNNQGIQV
jgi:hypothetical protein